MIEVVQERNIKSTDYGEYSRDVGKFLLLPWKKKSVSSQVDIFGKNGLRLQDALATRNELT